jgi:hypothetical protein
MGTKIVFSLSLLLVVLLIVSPSLPVALSNQTSLTSEMQYGKDEFTFVNVTITVQGINGSPIRDMEVTAFNEEWGTVYPTRWSGERTDSLGQCVLRIFKGNWTFFATGWSINRGFYALQNRIIDSNTSLLIQTDFTLNVTVSGFDLHPLDGADVYVIDKDHIPMVRLPRCGGTDLEGHLIIEVTANTTYNLAISRGPPLGFSSGEAFLIHVADVHEGDQVNCSLRKEELAVVSFDVFNGTGTKGDASRLQVQIPSLSLQSEFGFWRDQNIRWNNMTLWMSPEYVRFSVWAAFSGWGFDFQEEDHYLEPNCSYNQLYGGNLSSTALFYPEPGWGFERQIMILVKDQYGHRLAGFHDDNNTCKIPITLIDRDTQAVVYDGSLDFIENILPVDPTNCYFEIPLNLGFFGFFELSGKRSDYCVSLGNSTTEHFVTYFPSIFAYRFSDFPDYAEQVYSLMSTEIGHEFKSTNPDSKIHVYFALWHPGWCAGSTISMSSGWLFHPLHYPDPQLKGAFQHELAHSFQDGLEVSYYIEGETFGEPFASFLSTVVHTDMYGRNISLYYQSTHSDNFFKYLDGDKSIDMYWRMFFVLVYLKQRYHMEIHRDFVQLWGNSSLATRKQKLFNAGFNLNETIAVLYSFLAKENLAWLFQLVGLDISEQRVIEGLSVIETNIIDHIVQVDGRVFHVVTESNSAVSNLVLDHLQMKFNISGDSGAVGYCNVTIPKSLMNCTTLNDWIVWVNSEQLFPPDLTATENATHTFIYFTCTFASSLQVTIKGTYVVREFSSPAILLLSTATILLAITVKRKHGKLSRL